MECIFCKIASGEINAEVIYEDEMVIAFNDANPVAPIHFLIIPKRHIGSLNEVTENNTALMGHILIVAKQITEKLGVSEDGYRIVNNCGKYGGQTVNHIHFHILSGRSLQWPPG